MNTRIENTHPIPGCTIERHPNRSLSWVPPTIAGIALATALLISGPAAVAQPLQCSRTYTVDADFDEGLLQNLNHDSPNNNQLQLNPNPTPLPNVWIANSGRGTVVRVDVNTGAVLGEYRTAPDQRFRNPSRTTVDFAGNIWVGNRDETGAIGGVPHGSVVKIGLVIGGTRTNSAGVPDVNGQYLKPPFIYSTAVDRDGDGLIKTSRGAGNILAWSDPTDLIVGDVADAEDEAIIIYKRVPRAINVRHVSIDANNDVWVGGYPNAVTDMLKLDGDDGSILATLPASRGCGGYGGFVDGYGVLWSAGALENSLMRYDPSTNTTTCIPVGNSSYGLGIDFNGYIWNTQWTANRIVKVDPAGNIVAGFPKTWVGASNCRGVCATFDNDIWVANSGNNTVSRLDNNGNLLATIPVGIEPTGVTVDGNGKVWAANLQSNNLMRINPATNTVDLTVPLGAGAGPYNYGDMTGMVGVGSTSQQGTWTTVLNAGASSIDWGKISWNGSTPAGTHIDVEVRAANSQAALTGHPFLAVTNGASFCGAGLSGQYLEIRTTLSRDVGVTDSPILYDLTAQMCDIVDPVITPAAAAEMWPPNHDYQTFAVAQCVAGVSDNCNSSLSSSDVRIYKVTSDEVEDANGGGDGNTSNDMVIAANCQSVQLRRERMGGSNGRVYTIYLMVDDGSGNVGTATYKVKVRHSQAQAAVENAIAYTVNSSCSLLKSVPAEPPAVAGYSLMPNVPNPFSTSTTIEFVLSQPGHVTLTVHDVNSNLVATLVDADQSAGDHSVLFDASEIRSGMYICRLQINGTSISRRMFLIR